MKNNKSNLEKITGMGVFSALAFVMTLILSPIPPVAGFLSIDLKDAVIVIASFIYGPVSAVLIPLVVSLIEWFTISSTGWYGFIMNFLSSAAFALIATTVYHNRRNINMAMTAFFFSTTIKTAIMLLLNLLITPLYMTQIGVPMSASDVAEMIPKILLPFNLANSMLNSAVAILLYKPILISLEKARLIKTKHNFVLNKSSIIMISIGFSTLIVAVITLLLI